MEVHPDDKRIGVRAYRERGRVVFAVEDNGIGIAPRERKKIFRRVLSGRPPSGARIRRRWARSQHRGAQRARARRLHRCEEPARPRQHLFGGDSGGGMSARILIVEDEAALLRDG